MVTRSLPSPLGRRALLAGRLGAAVLGIALPAAAQKLPAEIADQLSSVEIADGWTLRAIDADTDTDSADVDSLRSELLRARAQVEAFFGAPFPDPLAITVAPDRETFTAVLGAEWGVPETQCWMVATGVADFVVVLSPRRWSDQACEHDPGDEAHLYDLLVHELTHAYHGQRNPTRDFTGAEEIGWFAEGLAVLVAEQLDRDRLADPAEALAFDAGPTSLAQAWSGKYRYGVSGSIVELIDHDWGREVLVGLLAETRQEPFLARLEVDEETLLARWRRWVESGRGR